MREYEWSRGLKAERRRYMNNNPSIDEIKFVKDSLVKYNNENVGEDAHLTLNLVEYDRDGNIVGGLLGGTYWGWLYVDILWVDKNFRKSGIGSKLLKEAEKEAARRGCHHVHLDTMSWQAPEFYKKHGYEAVAVIPDIPKGYEKYVLVKSLENTVESL